MAGFSSQKNRNYLKRGFGFTSCSFLFQTDNKTQYKHESISDFIKNEVRPVLTRDKKNFTVTMMRTCPNGTNAFASLNMGANMFYIHGINGMIFLIF